MILHSLFPAFAGMTKSKKSALAGKADALVTGDKDLLSLAGKCACPILGAEEFFQRFDIKG